MLAKLLYSPLYTIYWGMYHYPKVQLEFKNFEKMTLNPSPKDIIKIVDDHQPKLEDFKDLNVKMQKAIFDFKMAKLFGFEDRYYGVILVAYSNIFTISTTKEHIYFNYLNFISNLNSNEKQKYLSLRASTKDLEKQIFEEKLKFIKHYDDFYDYLERIGYLDKGAWYKGMANIYKIIIYYFTYDMPKNLKKFYSLEDKKLALEKMKRSYEIFNNLDLNSTSKIPSIANKNWRNAFKDFSNASYNWINEIQKALDECK
ncbi:hypothetical protein E0371_08320 [Campylobacter coli]|nr:hypothetical protein [Campylobacter coli]